MIKIFTSNYLHSRFWACDCVLGVNLLRENSKCRQMSTEIYVGSPRKYTYTRIYCMFQDICTYIYRCISDSTNTLGKCMNAIILPPVMGKK